MIDVQNIVKKFHEFSAVDNVSFKVAKGEILAFLGPNGAGKTTTIKMCTTLMQPTSGKILINGINPAHDSYGARNSFGIIFQDPSLDDELTAKENLEIHTVLYNVPKKVRQERIEQLLKFVELWDRKDQFVKTFSGGMKRRLEIARGLTHHPKILFLDEPTQGLDPQTRNNIWEYIKKLNKEEEMTVFFSTHYMEEAEKVADRIIVIDQGKIVAEGTSEKLKQMTNTQSLEDAFLSLTGHTIRDEEASDLDHLRERRKMFRR